MIPNVSNMPLFTEILSSADDKILQSPAPLFTHRKATQTGFKILPLSHPSRVPIPAGRTSTNTTEAPSGASNPRKAAQTGFTIKPHCLPPSATISACKNEHEARQYDRERGFTHWNAAPVEFSIIPLPPVDGPADSDFGNQHAFGAWLDAEEMDGEISSATDDDISSSPAPSAPTTDAHPPVITMSPTDRQNSRVRGGTHRKAQNTGFKILPLGHPDRTAETYTVSLTKFIFSENSC